MDRRELRVVQLVTQAVGGPADHAVDVARELAARGYDSHVVGPCRALAGAEDSTVRWHDVAMASKHDLRGARAVAATIRSLQPDVLHCQDRRAGLIGRALGRANGVPALVYTLHGVADGLADLVPGNLATGPRRHRDRWYYLTGERWLQRVAGGRVVVPSRAVADFATTHVGLPVGIVDVVANGVDANRFTPYPRGKGRPVTAVWLGVMAPVKRLDVLLQAVAALDNDLTLRLVGTGPERDAVEKAAAALGIAHRVELPGPVRDPAAELVAGDIFVLPSAAENCPLALLQAMACGLPVVASRVGGIPEVVRDGVEGLLVPPGSAAALATALGRLVADPVERQRMGARARERIMSRFTIAACVDDLSGTYRKALSCTC
jgi:glycosyltransferase involved in cell wall biosynthesis